ncbi:MAG: metallophosphoesterase family protein, partial [Actinomycetes bacterium]
LGAAVGAWLGLLIGGRVPTQVGPGVTSATVAPSWTGDTVLSVPPLGAVTLDTHDGPLRLNVEVRAIDPARAKQIFDDPNSLNGLEKRVLADAEHGLLVLALRSAGVAVLGAFVVGLVVYRRPTRAVISAGVAVVLLAASAGSARLTWRSDALAEPHYTGLLTSAPSLVGNAEDIVGNFSKYRVQLARLVTNVSRLYDTTLSLPTYAPSGDTIRILVVSDIHDNPAAFDIIRSTIAQFGVEAVVDAGDISDHGLDAENDIFAPIATLGVPYIWVRGNHDSYRTQVYLSDLPNVQVLDDSTADVAGLRFLGIGDPNFTPDKSGPDDKPDLVTQSVGASLKKQAAALQAAGKPVDVIVVHEPDMARAADGAAPLAISGHLHHRLDEQLPHGTRLFVEGTTGGSGLRALEKDKPYPIELSVLYFARDTKQLAAWDDIRLGGLGQESASIQRHLATSEDSQGSQQLETEGSGTQPSQAPSAPAAGPSSAPASAPAAAPASPHPSQ